MKELKNLLVSDIKEMFDKHSFYFVREDGLVLFQYSFDSMSDLNAASIGALIGGVWQASNELGSNVAIGAGDDLKLSFGSSDSGVYIIGLDNSDNQKMFFCCMYQKEINPGLLKMKVGKLGEKISKRFDEHMKQKKSHKIRDNFLFDNITDDEIDRLFGQAGC